MIWLIRVSQERLPKFLLFRRLQKSMLSRRNLITPLARSSSQSWTSIDLPKKSTFKASDFRSWLRTLLTTCNTWGHSSKSISENTLTLYVYSSASWDNQRSWICNWLRNYSNDNESIRRRYTIHWLLIAGTARK